jgi:hypothetical protein
MVNRDIEETHEFMALAHEFIKAARPDPSRRLADLPDKTLMLDFVDVTRPLSGAALVRAFPKLTTKMCSEHGNNPLKFDWRSLATAIDMIHSQYIWKPEAVK